MARCVRTLGGVLAVALFVWVNFMSYAAFSENVRFYGRQAGYLTLNNSAVSLGPLRVDPTDPARRRCFFEARDAMTIRYRCYAWVIKSFHGEWEVKISGDNFMSGIDSIPISQLLWKTPNSSYRSMPSQGNWTSIDKCSNYKTLSEKSAEHTLVLSLKLPLTNDEYAGEYQGTFYATMVFN